MTVIIFCENKIIDIIIQTIFPRIQFFPDKSRKVDAIVMGY